MSSCDECEGSVISVWSPGQLCEGKVPTVSQAESNVLPGGSTTKAEVDMLMNKAYGATVVSHNNRICNDEWRK